MSRALGLNLSHLTQSAIQAILNDRPEESAAARVDAASSRIAKLGLNWPDGQLQRDREEANER